MRMLVRARLALLRLGDEAFLAHPCQHDVAALDARRRDSTTATALDGARARPAISAHSARFNCFAGRPNRCRDIVSTP